MKSLKITTLLVTILSFVFNTGAGIIILMNKKYSLSIPLLIAAGLGYCLVMVFMFINKYKISLILSIVSSGTITYMGYRYINEGLSASYFYKYHFSSLLIPVLILIIVLVNNFLINKKNKVVFEKTIKDSEQKYNSILDD